MLFRRHSPLVRAIGARSSTVRRLIVLEGVFIAVVSCLIAMIPVLPLTAIMTNKMPVHVPLGLSMPGVLIWIGVAILGAAIATTAPAYRASRLTVREALTAL
jgi:putative ABC transport system permease protein